MRTPDDTRSKILRSAGELLLDKGYDFSVSDVRRKAGVSNGSFYYLFRDKNELVAALAADLLANRQAQIVAAVADAKGPKAIRAAITAYLQWSEADPDRARLLLRLPSVMSSDAHDVGGAPAIVWQEIAAIEEWGVPLAGVRALPPAAMHALIFGPAEQVVRSWIAGVTTDSPSALAPALAEMAGIALSGPLGKTNSRRGGARRRELVQGSLL